MATARPPQAEPISAVGTYGSASVSPSRPDRPPPRGRPELAEKPCFPTEVPSKPPELPAQNSPSFLHQIDRVSPISVYVSALDFASRVSRTLGRITDQADYGPLHPARATRSDLVSSRNLPAGQADHKLTEPDPIFRFEIRAKSDFDQSQKFSPVKQSVKPSQQPEHEKWLRNHTLLNRFGGETKENFELEVWVASKEPPSENMVFRPTQGGPGVGVGQVLTATRRRTRRYPQRRSARPVVAGPSPGSRTGARHGCDTITSSLRLRFGSTPCLRTRFAALYAMA
ncbi:hypothetical protein L3X38_031379 [Prunus dulcis]|uniref:Uncharacterized protein n=1 Tax=Prunus dulcis TaxID=3755 RepID=A0AAD4VEA1_PRUDU|nr:hypothetical protein L3X38_031379 [Prunus dulcis]